MYCDANDESVRVSRSQSFGGAWAAVGNRHPSGTGDGGSSSGGGSRHSFAAIPANGLLARARHVSRSHANLSSSTPTMTGTTSSSSSSSCGSSSSSANNNHHRFRASSQLNISNNNNYNSGGGGSNVFGRPSAGSRAKSFLFRPGSAATLPSHPGAATVTTGYLPPPAASSSSSSSSSGGGGGAHSHPPNPRKMAAVADALTAGLSACVDAAREDIARLSEIVERGKNSGAIEPRAGKLFESERELKRAQHELKLGELARSQVERLREEYNLQERLRDGARAMAAAFASGPSMRRKGPAVDKVRSGYWDCVAAMSELEARLEAMVGVFHCQIQGIQGFARLCPGDVFELSFRHSRQKWKTRGRVGKDGTQTWDQPRATFKASCFADAGGGGAAAGSGEYVPGGGGAGVGAAGSPAVLVVKAREIKRGPLGQKVLLGRRECDLLRLMAPRPIALTLPLNQSGSLKLSMLVVWRPLDAAIMNAALGGSSQMLSTLPSSTSSSSALSVIGRGGNSGSFAYNNNNNSGGNNNNRQRHWSQSELPVSSAMTATAAAANKKRYTPSDDDDDDDDVVVGGGEDEDVDGDAARDDEDLRGGRPRDRRRRHESLPASDSSDRDNMTMSSSSSSRNTGSSGRDETSSFANTLSWSGSGSSSQITLDRGSNGTADECSSCMSTSTRSTRSSSMMHASNGGGGGGGGHGRTGRPSGDGSGGRVGLGVVPSDPLDLNFTLTKRPDWGLAGYGLRDRFMARSCPAVDLIAATEEEEEQGEEEQECRVAERGGHFGPRGRHLEGLIEESLVDDDDDDDQEEEGDGCEAGEECSPEDRIRVGRLLDLISKVVAIADDVRGRFSQLSDFEAQVDRLRSLADVYGRKSIHDSGRKNSGDSLAAIEKVLECFDFLNNELDASDDETEKRRHDGGPRSVSGGADVDLALCIHLEIVVGCLEDLGNFGPLKEREKRAIGELSRQAFALRVLLDSSSSGLGDEGLKGGRWEFVEGDASGVWRAAAVSEAAAKRASAARGVLFLATKAAVVSALTPKVLEFWRGGAHRLDAFLDFVLRRISGTEEHVRRDGHFVTVFQFRDFFTGKLVVPCLLDLAREYDLVCDISEQRDESDELDAKGKSRKERRRREALVSMMSMKSAPPPGAVLAASHLLCSPSTPGCDLSRRYFASVVTHHPPNIRSSVEKGLLEGLESKNEKDREGSCRGLAIIGPGSKAIGPLAYLANSDPCQAVRRASKEALVLMGEEGQAALSHAVLSSHGFQGLCLP